MHSSENIAGLNTKKSRIYRSSKVSVPNVALSCLEWSLFLIINKLSVSLISVLLTVSGFNLTSDTFYTLHHFESIQIMVEEFGF